MLNDIAFGQGLSGGGYVNELSRAKSRAIKTPLHLHKAWNIMVNRARTFEELFAIIGQSDNEEINKNDNFNGLF